MVARLLLLVSMLAFAAGCAEQKHPPLKVGFNTWPGYEFIYLAQVKGFYEQAGVDVKLVELNSLGDVRRAFERGQIDIMASTLVELVIAAESSGHKLVPIAITDASKGADKLISTTSITSLADLRGKRVGAEPGTVDTLVVAAAMRYANLDMQSITFEFASQDDLIAKIHAGEIDAIQTYPPYATKLLDTPGFHVLFDTQQIPDEIFDVLSVKQSLINERNEDLQAFLRAFFQAVDYYFQHPQESAQIMAQREGITADEFIEAINSMHIFTANEQLAALQSPKTEKAIQYTIDVLHTHGWLANPATAKDFSIPLK